MTRRKFSREFKTEWTCPGKVESSSEGKGSIPWADRNAGSARTSRRRPFVWSRRAAGRRGGSLKISASGCRRCGAGSALRRERDLDAPPPGREEDVAAELKRLRRENEILRQEREILKRAATFFAKEGSR